MTYELRRRLLTLIRILPTLGLHDDARALARHLLIGDVARWLLTSEHGIETLATIAGGLEVAEHLTIPRTSQAHDVRLAREALGELNVLLEDERAEIERAICGRAA